MVTIAQKLAKTFAAAERKDLERFISYFCTLAEKRKEDTIASVILNTTSAALRMKNREEATRLRRKSKR
ncbi:MAG: hypothetical protein LiPW15_262 [Parcubacteria group bacterium LiPW_15]|nr:MAG: hypothetical protein LiPW15_262 [Parcubacteria group bacterium LiPW_15]